MYNLERKNINDIYKTLHEPVLEIINKSVNKTISLFEKIINFIENDKYNQFGYSGKINSFLFNELMYIDGHDIELSERSTIISSSDTTVRLYLTDKSPRIIYWSVFSVYNELQKRYVLSLSLFINKELMSLDAKALKINICTIINGLFEYCLACYGNLELRLYYDTEEISADKELGYYLSFAKYYLVSSILDKKAFNNFEDMKSTGLDYINTEIQSKIFEIAYKAACQSIQYIDAINTDDMLKVFRKEKE